MNIYWNVLSQISFTTSTGTVWKLWAKVPLSLPFIQYRHINYAFASQEWRCLPPNPNQVRVGTVVWVTIRWAGFPNFDKFRAEVSLPNTPLKPTNSSHMRSSRGWAPKVYGIKIFIRLSVKQSIKSNINLIFPPCVLLSVSCEGFSPGQVGWYWLAGWLCECWRKFESNEYIITMGFRYFWSRNNKLAARHSRKGKLSFGMFMHGFEKKKSFISQRNI